MSAVWVWVSETLSRVEEKEAMLNLGRNDGTIESGSKVDPTAGSPHLFHLGDQAIAQAQDDLDDSDVDVVGCACSIYSPQPARSWGMFALLGVLIGWRRRR